jgi:hypothetical protein
MTISILFGNNQRRLYIYIHIFKAHSQKCLFKILSPSDTKSKVNNKKIQLNCNYSVYYNFSIDLVRIR